jgi:hypothetical protein
MQTPAQPKMFYHGTIADFVPKIQSEGIKSIPSYKFYVNTGWGSDMTNHDDRVYVSPEMTTARAFAISKHFYFAARPGDLIHGPYAVYKSYKAPQVKVGDSSPVVIKLDLTGFRIERDEQADDADYLTTVIPPERIVGVEPVKIGELSSDDLAGDAVIKGTMKNKLPQDGWGVDPLAMLMRAIGH